MQTYKDLGSIKFSLYNMLESTKSEFTCCSINFARALVIGPILISSSFFLVESICSSCRTGDVLLVGMSSSIDTTLTYDVRNQEAQQLHHTKHNFSTATRKQTTRYSSKT